MKLQGGQERQGMKPASDQWKPYGCQEATVWRSLKTSWVGELTVPSTGTGTGAY